MAKQSNKAGKTGNPVAPAIPPIPIPPIPITPDPAKCVDDAMYIPQEKSISVFGTFNIGLLPTTVELGVLDSSKTFQPELKATHDPLIAGDVTASEIRVVLKVAGGADEGLKYVRVTQGGVAGAVTGISKKGIFTLWRP
jgi:hypothetical protein